MIKECCVCGKQERNGLWSREPGSPEEYRVSHGYCPVCYREFMERLDRLFPVRGKLTLTFAATVEPEVTPCA
ncbi:MAG: hypothetical protein C4563_04935 [Desulfobulbus sp.]|jgi:hypothetical protein|nr:MAG: hypothetical protein C4563_04935 [Desulfobulbus sp.]